VKIVLAVDSRTDLAPALAREGHDVVAEVAASALSLIAEDGMLGADAERTLRSVAARTPERK
jgi:hypothetical protein